MRRLILAAAMSIGLSACCNDPNSIQCIVTHAVVDCTTDTVVANAPGFIPFITQLVQAIFSGGTGFDWAAFGQKLAALGLKDAACIAATIEAAYEQTPATAGPEKLAQAKAFHDGWSAWVAQHFPTGTRFKLPGGLTL